MTSCKQWEGESNFSILCTNALKVVIMQSAASKTVLVIDYFNRDYVFNYSSML